MAKTSLAKERRRGRELALQALYLAMQTDINPHDALKTLPGWTLASDISKQFVEMLLERLHRHDADISKTIAEVIQHWERQRVARIDDCIIRLGACELIACPDIPAAVSINEAIELAKKYSTEHSGRFVNGILDAMAAHYLTAEVEK